MLQKLQISKTTTFSESSGRQLSHGTPYIGHTLSKVWVICVLVSQVFVFFGVFSTELLTLPCKITEVGRLSLFIEFFVGFHIVCDRYTLDNAHFTYFNTILPLSLSSTFGTAFITGSHIVSYQNIAQGGDLLYMRMLIRNGSAEAKIYQTGPEVSE